MQRTLSSEDISFVIENHSKMSDLQIAKELNFSHQTIGLHRRLLGFYKGHGRKTWFDLVRMPIIMEDFWCNNESEIVLSKKYNIAQPTISKYTSMLFFKKKSESTITITLKSKI